MNQRRSSAQEIIWVRPVWDLDGLEIRLEALQGYDFASASTGEEKKIINVVLDVFVAPKREVGG